MNRLPQMAALVHAAAHVIVEETCADILDTMQQLGAVDTGFMISSAYIKTSSTDTYGQGGIDPPGDSYLMDEEAGPPNDTTGYIYTGANYSQFLEYGTSRAAAQPWVTPAAEQERPIFMRKFENLESRL